MRGEVEIWNGDELIHKESNLLVNGAGEAIADMLTVSPSLSGIPSASALLDTSNYTIQAISFGKDASAYQFNAHAIPERRNLWYVSTPSSSDDVPVSYTNGLKVSSVPEVSPPPQYAHIPSSTAHAVMLIDDVSAQNAVLQLSQTPNGSYNDWTVSGPQDLWICHSVYLKWPDQHEFTLFPEKDTDTTFYHPRTQVGLAIKGEGYNPNESAVYSRGGYGYSRLGTNIHWNDSTATIGEPSSISLSYANAAEFGDARRAASGYSIDNWQQNGGLVPVGDGWYRAWAAGLSPASGVSSIVHTLYPVGWESNPTGETQGAMYAYGFQLEVGRWPTDFEPTNYRRISNWDFSGSVLNRDHNLGAVEDNGTVRVIPPYGTSSYVPTNYLSNPPNPESTRVEDGDTALLDLSSDALRNFNMGQNLNVVPYRKNPGGSFGQAPLEGSMELFPYNVTEGEQQVTWMKAYADGKLFPGPGGELSGVGSFGPQSYYLGCFPEGSSTGGSNFALVSSLDNSDAYPHNYVPSSSPYFVTGTYNSIVNEASSMDVSGFVGKVYDPQNTVGVIADVNKLGWTDPETIENTPGITFNSDLNGAFWGEDNVGTFSAIAATNPIGGPSSFHFSGAADSTVGYCLLKGMDGASRFNDWTATGTQIASVYFKRPGNSTVAPSSVMIKIKDSTSTVGNYTNYFEYLSDGLVPTLKNQNAYCTTHIEDAGNDWYRIIMRVDGLADTSKTNEGDNSQYQIYLGDSIANDVTNVRGKYMLFWGPQFEQYPLSLGLSAQPFQNVAGDTPTIAEQNGVGGLNVSGGIDTTNSGTVEYSIIVGSGDVGYSNLYGGIYNMGLWTIDTEESRLAGNMAPYSFGPLDNPRKYKLFATKHLTKNLGFIEDSGGHPGCLSYNDLTIKWRIHFT